jgi:hypothetical protein
LARLPLEVSTGLFSTRLANPLPELDEPEEELPDELFEELLPLELLPEEDPLEPLFALLFDLAFSSSA